jgi:hypothetical protein
VEPFKTEKCFFQSAIREKLAVRPVTLSERRKKISFVVSSRGKNYSIVVIPLRPKRPKDFAEIELKSNLKKNGWLYGSSDIIAFERSGDFFLVGRKNLIKLCKLKIDFTKLSKTIRGAQYATYRSKTTQSLVTFLPFSDLKRVAFKIVRKMKI